MNDKTKIPLGEVNSASCCGTDCCSDTTTATATLAGSAAAHVKSGEPTGETIPEGADVRTVVREKYALAATGESCACGCCDGPSDPDSVLAAIGYTAEQASAIPEGANLGLGCGNPIAHAALKSGEVVLDLGSGGGIDCFLAAREVGPTGRAIGVDMTPAMLERARATQVRAGITNVEFRLGEIEHLPLADGSVNAIISNCVVNLSPDKLQVFREAVRVLRPGGRLVVSDLVLTKPISAELQKNVALYVGCVAGASLEADYLQLMRDAGFGKVEVLERHGYSVGMETLAENSPEREAFQSVVSVKVRAVRA